MWSLTSSSTFTYYNYIKSEIMKCAGCGVLFHRLPIDNPHMKVFCKKCAEKGKQLNLF